jgi:hypothetical protein
MRCNLWVASRFFRTFICASISHPNASGIKVLPHQVYLLLRIDVIHETLGYFVSSVNKTIRFSWKRPPLLLSTQLMDL